MRKVYVSAPCGGTRGRDFRFFQEASLLGDVHLLLWPAGQEEKVSGEAELFTPEEREYLARSIRYIREVHPAGEIFDPDAPPFPDLPAGSTGPVSGEGPLWFYRKEEDSPARRDFCRSRGLEPVPCPPERLEGYPPAPSGEGTDTASGERKKVLVTGCFDLFHTGHVRFFEEVSRFGDLYVVIGSDRNVRLLKGEGRPLFREEERRYIIQSIRYVRESLVSTGSGWMDAEPEIHRLKPDIYAVNEDGDVPEKREFCEKEGLTYLILKRTPREGLPARSSTQLRGF